MPLGLAPLASDPIGALAGAGGVDRAYGTLRFGGTADAEVVRRSIAVGTMTFGGSARASVIGSGRAVGTMTFAGRASAALRIGARGRGRMIFNDSAVRPTLIEKLPSDLSLGRAVCLVREEPLPTFSFDVEYSRQGHRPIDRGPAFALLRHDDWTRPSNIGPGSRLVEVDGTGLAVVTGVPTPQVRVLPVEIVEPFARAGMGPYLWAMRPRRVVDLDRYVPERMSLSKLLPDIYRRVETHLIDEAYDGAERIDTLRRWDVAEAEYLKDLQRTLGMLLDLSGMTEGMHRRVLAELNHFYAINGTESFIHFMGFVLDAEFTIFHLYSNDYKTFKALEEVPTASRASYYPTNRVRLDYRINTVEVEEDELKRLFYNLASAVLVLEEIRKRRTVSTSMGYMGLIRPRSRTRFTGGVDFGIKPSLAYYGVIHQRSRVTINGSAE